MDDTPPPSEKSHVVLFKALDFEGLGLGGCKNSSKIWSFCRKIILKLLNKNTSLGADIVHPNHLWELSHPTLSSLSGRICLATFEPLLKGAVFQIHRFLLVFPSLHVPWIHPQQQPNCRRKTETTSVPAKKNTPSKKHTNLVSFI